MPLITNGLSNESAPALCSFPRGVPRRLVDGGLLHYEASIAGFAERYRRGESPHTVHVWWARRPHTAMRALLYACLSTDQSDNNLSLMQQLASSVIPPPLVLKAARDNLTQDFSHSPRVLDMFGGGGTIGFEAALLGAETYSLDSNELSVFLQRSILDLAHDIPRASLINLIETSGTRVLSQLETDTATLFPLRNRTFAYLWTYSTECTECSYRFFLSKRPWVSRKSGRRIALTPQDGDLRQEMQLRDVSGSDFTHGTPWLGRNGTVECPKCGHRFTGITLKNTTDELVALIGSGQPRGKVFSDDVSGAIPPKGQICEFEARILKRLDASLPTSRLPRWSGIVNPTLYGIDTHADFLNGRQRAVLLSLIQNLRDEYERLLQSETIETSKAVVCLLSGLIDQVIDWNCRLSMWISQNEQVGRAFSGPGVPMLWDYVETDPVSRGPANLWAKLNRIVAGTKTIGQLTQKCDVRHGYAQELPYQDDFFDAIVTDPPYYDNIFYNVLADFFYSWKRLLLAKVDPHLFASELTDSTRELVASSFRSGDADRAHSEYCEQLCKVMHEAERVLKKDGVFSLLYSHSSLQGWEALIRAYRPTGLRITSVQPLSIERKARPRAMTSDAINTCVVFVARRASKNKSPVRLDELSTRLVEMASTLGESLRNAGWSDADIGVAVFAQAVGLIANASRVANCESDIAALKSCAEICSERFPAFRVVSRKPL